MAGLKGLNYQPFVLPLAAGPNTKHDERSLPAPQMAAVENGVYDKDGGIQKAPGRAGVSTIYDAIFGEPAYTPTLMSDIKALMAYRDELLIVEDNELYTRAPNAGDVGGQVIESMSRGRFESVRVEQDTVRAYVTGSGAYTDRAEGDEVELYAWGDGTVYYRAIDQVTGAVLGKVSSTEKYADFEIATATTPKVRNVGGQLHIYYINTTPSPRELKLLVIDPGDVNSTLNPTPKTLATDVHVGSHYDVDVDTGNGVAYVAYRDNTGASGEYTLLTVNSAGTVSDGPSAKARACTGAIACSFNSTSGDLMVARVSAAATVHTDWHQASDLSDGTVGIASGTMAVLAHLTCVALRASESGYTFFDSLDGTSYPRVMREAIASGSATERVLVRHSRIASRAKFGDDLRTLMHVVYGTGTQQTQYVLMDCEKVVGNRGQDGASGTQNDGDEVGLLARLYPGEGVLQTVTTGHLPQIERTAADVYKWAPKTRDLLPVSEERLYNGTMRAEISLQSVKYTFGDARSYDAVEAGQSLYCPGGFLAQYDGRRMYESAFFCYPEQTTITNIDSSGANTLVAGDYVYRLYWEWRNDRGEVEQSTSVGKVTHTFASPGTEDTIQIVVPTLPYTLKENVVLAVYRAGVDPVDGAPLHRVSGPAAQGTGSASYMENDVNADELTWQDLDFNDSEALSNELDYQNTGELDNVACPAPPLAITSGQGRLFWVHADARDSSIGYSKLRRPGKLVAFNEALRLQVPDLGGKIIAIAPGEDEVLIFKETAIYLAAGIGPDNLGSGDYVPPQLVSSDQGCEDPRTVVRLPHGTMFKGKKGWHLLDRGHQVHFIGGKPEDYNSRTVTGVLPYPSEHRVVILSSDAAGSYMYDYRRQEWSDWSILPSIVDGALSKSLAYYLEPSNVVSVETPAAWAYPTGPESGGAFPTAGYSLAVDTGWVTFDHLVSYARAKGWQLLGGWHGAQSFDVRVRVAYGFDDTWVDDFTFSPNSADEVAGLPLRIRSRFTQGKRSAVRMRIEDIVQGSNSARGEAMRLTGIGIDVGFKRGLHRLPASQTTG